MMKNNITDLNVDIFSIFNLFINVKKYKRNVLTKI